MARKWKAAPEQSEKAIARVSAFMTRFRAARDARTASGIEEIWQEAVDLYYQRINEAVEGTWRSKAFAPHATREVNNLYPHLTSIILDAPKLVSLKAMNEACSEYAALDEELVNYQLTQRTGFADKWDRNQFQCALYGTTVSFTGFEVSLKRSQQEVTQAIQPGQEEVIGTEEVLEMVDGTNTFEDISIDDVWVDPSASPDHITRLFYYEKMTKRQMKANPLIDKKALELLPETSMSSYEFITENIPDYQQIGPKNEDTSYDSAMDPEDRVHHVLWEWDEEKKVINVVADGAVELLHDEPYPYKHKQLPFVFQRWQHRNQKKFYGVGVIELIASTCRAANKTRRQRDDNLELSMHHMFVTRQGSIVNPKRDLRVRPGGNIAVNGNLQNAIKVLEVPNVTNDAFRYDAIYREDIEDVNGSSRILAGQGDPNARTAIGGQLVTAAATIRLRTAQRRALEALQKIVYMMVSNNRQFMPPMAKAKIVGSSALVMAEYAQGMDAGTEMPVVKILPADLYNNNAIEVQQLINTLNVMGSMGLTQILDQKQLAIELLKRGANVKEDSPLLKGLMLQKNLDISAYLDAQAEASYIIEGQPIQPQLEDNHEMAIAVLQKYKEMYPEFATAFEQQIKAHEQLAMQQIAMQQGLIGPMEQQEGAGGLNQNRMPQPTSADTMNRSMMNQLGAGDYRTQGGGGTLA